MSAYRTIAERAQAEIVEKKSRFIAQIAPVATEEEALSFIEEVKIAHRMARHNVYAYVLRDGRVRYTDDGEPTKTAGTPTLETIRHADLVDVAVVVTRYFGGVLLGTGGLVRAYSSATQAAIDAARIVVISRCVEVTVELAYSVYEQAGRMACDLGAEQVDASFTDSVLVTFRLPAGEQALLAEKLGELTRGQSEILISEPFDAPLSR